MRGLEIEARSEGRLQVAEPARGKRLDQEAQGGARTEAGPVRERSHEQPEARGNRAREQDPRRERVSFEDRKRQAVTDVATYRVVSVKDLVEERFGGNAFAARRGIEQLKRKGLLKERTVQVGRGKSFKVLTATKQGVEQARENDPGGPQRYFSGLVKPNELRHDTAVYRASRAEISKIEQQGGTVTRVRLDYELKSRVARASERARARQGDEEARQARMAAARELELPVDEQGRVSYPDAQIEYTDEQGMSGRVDVEVTSGHYCSRDIQAKAAAGFALHANGRQAARRLALSLDPEGSQRGGGGPRRNDDLLEI